MLCGPTLKRLYREREARERERRRARWRSRTSAGRSPRPHLRPPVPEQQPAHIEYRGSSPFPLSMAALLELDRIPDVVVLDGQIRQIRWGLAHRGEPGAEMNGCCRKTRDRGLLHERLTRAMQTEWAALEVWARSTGVNWERADDFDALPGVQPTIDVGEVEEFLFSRLIPLLKQRSCRFREEGPAESSLSSLASEEVIFPGLERRFAFIGQRWHALVPFFGASGSGRFQLRLGDDQFVGVEVENRQKRLERYDALLQEAVREACARPKKQRAGRAVLFQDETYAVVATPRRRYFLCQHILPYAVEGPDHKLYFFEEVEVGMQITHTDVEQLMQPRKVRVMHPYRHMFLSDGGVSEPICMPRPERYYRELRQLPLEEALLRHLEAARMTLCAGYTPASTPYHSINLLGRRTLCQEEALERGLPIYRYYRGGEEEGSVWEEMLEILAE